MAHKNGSLICTVMLIWPFITTLCRWTVSPITRANSTRATPHSYAIHSLAKPRALGALSISQCSLEKCNKSTLLWKTLRFKSRFLHLSCVFINLLICNIYGNTYSWRQLHCMSRIMCEGPLGMQRTLFSRLYYTGIEQSCLSQVKLKGTNRISIEYETEENKQPAGLTHTWTIAARRQVFSFFTTQQSHLLENSESVCDMYRCSKEPSNKTYIMAHTFCHDEKLLLIYVLRIKP